MSINTTTLESDRIASMRYLVNSAVKDHALACSKQCRANYFKRVGQDFIDDVNAEMDRMIREIEAKYQPPFHPVVVSEASKFVTGSLMEKVRDVLDRACARLIQAKVQRHPSLGVTLKK